MKLPEHHCCLKLPAELLNEIVAVISGDDVAAPQSADQRGPAPENSGVLSFPIAMCRHVRQR
jgi:hypothetical protein